MVAEKVEKIPSMGGIYTIDGEKIVQFGGRHNGIYELSEDEDALWIPTKGKVYTPTSDLIIAIIYGEVIVIRGTPKFEHEATVHSSWKVRRNQSVLIYKKVNDKPKYIVYKYSDGSYSGCVVKIYNINGTKIFDYSGGRYTIKVFRKLGFAVIPEIGRKILPEHI